MGFSCARCRAAAVLELIRQSGAHGPGYRGLRILCWWCRRRVRSGVAGTGLPRNAWTTPSDVVAVLKRRWHSGELSAALAEGRSLVPQQVPVRGPSERQITAQFPRVRQWLHTWHTAGSAIRVEYGSTGARIVGVAGLPIRAWVDTVTDLQELIGAGQNLALLEQMLEETQLRMPWLTPWVHAHVGELVPMAAVWPRVLDVVRWVMDHDGPGVHLRQLDLGDVDFTFVEEHHSVLAALLHLTVLPERVDTTSGVDDVARRFRLAAPARLRVRRLDGEPLLDGLPGGQPGGLTHSSTGWRGPTDLGISVTDLARVEVPARTVLLLRSSRTYEALPGLPGDARRPAPARRSGGPR